MLKVPKLNSSYYSEENLVGQHWWWATLTGGGSPAKKINLVTTLPDLDIDVLINVIQQTRT